MITVEFSRCCRYDEDQRFPRDPDDDRSGDLGRGGASNDGNGNKEGIEPFENGVPFVRGDNGQMFPIKQEHEIKHEMLDY